MPDDVIGPGYPAEDPANVTREQLSERNRLVQVIFGRLRKLIADREALVSKLQQCVSERDTFIGSITLERNALKLSLNEATASVSELSAKAAELEEELTIMMAPSHEYGVVARLNTEDGTADVFNEGQRYRVNIHPAVSAESLACGTTVVINGKTRAIQLVVDEADHIGAQAQITELLEDGRSALVEDSRGDKHVVLVGQSVPAEALEPNAPVLVRESVIVRSMQRGTARLGGGSRFLLAEMPDTTFDDIGGMDDVIAKIVASLENPYLAADGYEQLRHKKTISVLFAGLPGNGKTMLAKAIARRQFDMHREAILKYAKGNFFAVGGTELYDKWLGNTEKYLRDIFEAGEKLYRLTGAISFVFFDDCDALFLTRSAGLSTNINGSVATQFSTLVDGIRKLEGVSVIGATNRIDLVDTAVGRRFDRQVRIQPPDTPERASAVLNKILRSIPIVGGSTETAVNAIVSNVFAKTRENELVEVVFRKDSGGEEDSEIITLSQMISGKFLSDVVKNAKDLAIQRGLTMDEEHRVWALSLDDLTQSLHSELRNKESLPSSEATVADWLMQKGDKRVVSYVTNLLDRRKRDAKHDRFLDDKVV